MSDSTPDALRPRWRTLDDGFDLLVVENDLYARQGNGYAPICTLADQPDREDNGRLIAAAPETAAERDRLREVNAELLAALRGMVIDAERQTREFTVHLIHCDSNYSAEPCDCGLESGQRARAAITKAEGRV